MVGLRISEVSDYAGVGLRRFYSVNMNVNRGERIEGKFLQSYVLVKSYRSSANMENNSKKMLFRSQLTVAP